MEGMNTKQKGDIAEQAAILKALKRGWGVLHPVGDRLPYDLVFDLGGSLAKIQVKTAWVDHWTLDNPNRGGEPSTVLRVIDFGRFAGFRTLAKEASGTPSNYSGV